MESIRAGLVFKLKQSVGVEFIMAREEELQRRFMTRFKNNDKIRILGSDTGGGLPIFSFLIQHPQTGLFLHYNYVVALLNDLFGLQTRGGCACAGPYMQTLLGLNRDLVRRYEAVLVEDKRLDRVGLRRGHSEHSQWEVVRPGATRLNLPWFISDQEVEFILQAVEMVVEDGWRLLPVYRFNNETGEWRHHTNSVFRDRKWLGHVSFTSGEMSFSPNPLSQSVEAETSLEQCLEVGRQTIASASKLAARETVPDQTAAFPDSVSELRWFLTPSEAKSCLLNEDIRSVPIPFSPPIEQPLASPQQCPGSLSTKLNISGRTSIILNSSRSQTSWSPDQIQLSRTGISVVGRQSIRRSDHSTLQRSDSVTINGCTTINVNSQSPGNHVNGSKITTNGFKNVINVTGVNLTDEKTEINFEEEEELNCDKDMSEAEIVKIVEDIKLELSGQEKSNGASTNCDNGVCVIPGGKRETNMASLPANVAKWKSPSKEIFKPFVEAVTEFNMIKDGDKLLVCLSGGKDSLSLLHCVKQYQFYARSQGIHFQFGAVTVDPMSSAYDPRPLIPYLSQLGVEYFYEQQDIMGQALQTKASSICAFCSRMKRGRIYAAARKNGYNVLALGQHLDDLTESFFMSVFHNGRLRTMKASYTNAEGDLRIIRPLVYAREKSLRKFAESSKLPIIAENCPACFEAPKERQRVKQLLAQQELLYPRLYWNLKTALYPVMRIDKTGVESVVFGKTVENSTDDEEDDLQL